MQKITEKLLERSLPEKIPSLTWLILSFLLWLCDCIFKIGTEIKALIPNDIYQLLENVINISFKFFISSALILFGTTLTLALVEILLQLLERKDKISNAPYDVVVHFSHAFGNWFSEMAKMSLITYFVSSVLKFENVCSFIRAQNPLFEGIVIFVAFFGVAFIADEFKFIYYDLQLMQKVKKGESV